MAKPGILRQPQRKARNVAGALLILSVFAIYYSSGTFENPPAPEAQPHSHLALHPSPPSKPLPPSRPLVSPHHQSEPAECDIDLEIIGSFAPASTVLYSRWDIEVEQTEEFDNFSKRLDVPIPNFTPLEIGSGEAHRSLGRCSPDVKITAPRPVPVNASHLLFGLATSLERLYDSLDALAHWAGGTQARVFAVVEYGSLKSAVRQKAAELDIDLTLLESTKEVLDRYILLTKILLDHRDHATQWGVIIDDDTFFPSMHRLVERLATYDATKPQYVGALTEDLNRIPLTGYMAYGGAGIFLSLPLLEELDRYYDQCSELTEFGDKRIAQCIYLYTDAKFTWDRGLYQLDFHLMDGSGFYESGRSLPLSLHHYKSAEWYPVDIVGMSKVASVCGDDCQLHRWRISDSNEWFFINGFSVIHHSYPIKDDLGMEQTWDPSPWAREEGWAYSLGPLRPVDEGKITLRLRHAAVERDGSIRQIYVYNPEDSSPEDIDPDEMDPEDINLPYVHEVVWRLV